MGNPASNPSAVADRAVSAGANGALHRLTAVAPVVGAAGCDSSAAR